MCTFRRYALYLQVIVIISLPFGTNEQAVFTTSLRDTLIHIFIKQKTINIGAFLKWFRGFDWC